MSVDARTLRGTPRGLSMAEPELNTVKVPCDPAQVVVNHASFRVVLPDPPGGAKGPAPGRARRRPLVWTGRSAPGNPGASALLQAVRGTSPAGAPRPAAGSEAVATQVLPRVEPARDVGGTLVG